MNKRYVSVLLKSSGRKMFFATVAMIYQTLPRELLGISKNALYNALSKKGGAYENDKIIVNREQSINTVWK